MFYISFSYFELLSESVIFIKLFQHIGVKCIKMVLYAQQYFLHSTYCCLHNA